MASALLFIFGNHFLHYIIMSEEVAKYYVRTVLPCTAVSCKKKLASVCSILSEHFCYDSSSN